MLCLYAAAAGASAAAAVAEGSAVAAAAAAAADSDAAAAIDAAAFGCDLTARLLQHSSVLICLPAHQSMKQPLSEM